MENQVKKIGIIICDRYRGCAGGKCFRAAKERAGAFARYRDQELEIVGYTSCGGCPGGNIEYAPDEMKKQGATSIHFATGFLVGFPPCPYMDHFKQFIEEKYGLEVVFGTHPIPEKYFLTHQKLNTWDTAFLQSAIEESLPEKSVRLAYD
ncbi:MAG: CGGC domain-containing protein [Bacteroidetes bacterium]|nr:CGGC domain-containing protein [Bacteroidota bacterium]MBU1578172.1 CGGC domain-containing protein [Bacteroidota bacterium]MBU2466813.1 CGGC domain-containing protein [Bacteroidota bacterium]